MIYDVINDVVFCVIFILMIGVKVFKMLVNIYLYIFFLFL